MKHLTEYLNFFVLSSNVTSILPLCFLKSRSDKGSILSAISFSHEEIANEIKKHIPNLEISYAPDHRQKIADSWPASIDDSAARADWNWQNDFDMQTMTIEMLKQLKENIY